MNLHIVIVEDGVDNRLLLSRLLKRAGAEVTVFEHGLEATDWLLSNEAAAARVNVILMDLSMPVMDGYTATQRLRDAGIAIPIIALTAHAMAADRAKCLTSGFADYLAKPFELDVLLSLIQRHASAEQSSL